MSDLEAAIAAEMKRQGCYEVEMRQGFPTPDIWLACAFHNLPWDHARGECAVVAESVRAGWDAAINAAAEVIGKKQPRGGVTTDYDQGFLDGWDDHQAAVGREVRALLPEGGDRD